MCIVETDADRTENQVIHFVKPKWKWCTSFNFCILTGVIKFAGPYEDWNV